jgi:NlpC/P60 family putative phage cell wall peptidase
MTQGTEVVAEAREWLGTRWHHQAAVKGVGTDCIGLVRGVCARLGLTPSDIMSSVAASPFIGYGRTPYEGRLESACATFFTPITAEQAKPGDMVLISFDSVIPHHVGLLGDYPAGGFSLIHAYMPSRKVIESRLDAVWLSRVVSYWRLPGVKA